MNNDIKKKIRLDWIDFGKGISMFLVILYHSECSFTVSDNMYSNLFAFFRMPFFFFLSGYLFTSNYHNFSLKKKMLQIFRGIIWTYIIFTTVIWIPKSFSHGYSLEVGIKEILLGWASWFVIALGGAQIIFAVILTKTKNLKIIISSILFSLFLGYVIKLIHPERLPYQLDKTFLVLFFFGLGFLYRIWESKLDSYMKVNIKNLLLMMVCYFTIYFLDVNYLNTTQSIFQETTYNFFLLAVLYAIVGIIMMIQFVKVVPSNKYLCFLGINSLVFYYLNGGVISTLSILLNKTGIHIQDYIGYISVLLITIITSFIIGIIVKMIKRFCPIIIGDKKTFNSLAQKMHLKIQF